MMIWIAATVIISGFGMMIGVEILMNKLGIRPVDPELRSGGIRDIAEKVNRWSAQRRKDR
jgi:hypothetical protein